MNDAVKVRKFGKLNRIVSADSGRILKASQGAPVDGGGHKSKAKAVRQASHINDSMARRAYLSGSNG